MSAPTIDTQPVLTAPAEGAVIRCILCDRLWPKDQMPLWHTFVMSDVKPQAECCCGQDEDEPCWHAFEVNNSRGRTIAEGIVCPKCVAAEGLDAAVRAAMVKALRLDPNVN